MKITVFDTETTGIIPKNYDNLNNCPYMLQLASITYDTSSHSIISHINNIIKISDDITIPKTVSDINSITKERTNSEGVEICHVLNKFNNQLKNTDLLVAHNAEFDINIINFECMRNNIKNNYYDLGKDKVFCTMSKGTQLCKIKKVNSKGSYYKWPKLEELHNYLFGSVPKNLHDAYNDLLICLRCYMYMNYKIDIVEKNVEIKNKILSMINDNNINELSH
tara:strand:+ start:520 stop:1185 length:666 start_codon:yes stop_codon:yes gene_type:complete